ncbi:MAG: DUF1134 domain-containing protein [Pseudomonadota bacterium]
MPNKRPGPGRNMGLMMAALLAMVAAPAMAQVETIDPNEAIDADLIEPPASTEASIPEEATDALDYEPLPDDAPESLPADPGNPDGPGSATGDDLATDATAGDGTATADADSTYQKDDLIGAAEGVFGKGAKGLAGVIEDILKDQGEPNGYIVGREAGGALVVGLRYGSGTLYHKVEGERKVYWTGPSIGFDAGANAANSFTLVYNLYDTEDLFKRYGTGEGAAYFVGGFNVSYLRRGDVVLIPVHLGAGVRLGANIGYRKFSKKQRWLPF